MKHLIWALLPIVVLGCAKPVSTPGTPSTPAPTSTTSGTPAPTGGTVMPGGPGGGIVTGDLAEPVARPAQPAPTTQPATTEPAKPVIPRSPGRLVDAAEALKNPKVVVASTKIDGDDPLTAAMQAYFSVRAKAQILNFQNQVKISRELNDGKPLKYEQFMELVQMMKIEFMDLPPWQMLGYDAKAGTITLLEDKSVKIAHYKQSNIPLDAGDEKYDTP